MLGNKAQQRRAPGNPAPGNPAAAVTNPAPLTTPGARSGRWTALSLGLLLAATTLLTACGSDDEAAPSTPVQLLIKDKSLRTDGRECAAVLPLDYLHANAEYKVKDATGKTVGTGKLPPGVAIPALEKIDFGNAVRIPTFCEMNFNIPVAAADGLTLAVEEGKEIVLRMNPATSRFEASVPEDDPAAGVPLGDLGGGR